jgi:NTE family protein
MTTHALVLGGGGEAGVAWEIGLLAGLAQRGVDLRDADVVIGTSAGAIVGTLLLSGRTCRTSTDGNSTRSPPRRRRAGPTAPR